MKEKSAYQEILSFCSILAVALRSGRPLPDSMAELSRGKEENKASVWCSELGRKLAEGCSIEDACRNLADFDPVLARLMPLLGERRLIRILEIYSLFLVNMAVVQEQLKAVLFYPLAIFLLKLANLVQLNYFLIPEVYRSLIEAGRSPPWLMKMLYFAEPAFWPFSLVLPAVMTVLLGEMLRIFVAAKINSNSLAARFFGISGAMQLQEKSRLQGIIGLYLQSGFSLEKALAVTAEFAGNDERLDLLQCSESIAGGEEPQTAFARSKTFADISLSESELPLLAEKLKYLSESNNRHSTAMIRTFSRNMFLVTLLLSGLFVAAVTSSCFDSYYWVIWSFI
jgi:type II secretory pathway component PulF